MTARGYEGGNLLVDALAARGVERLFSVSGGPINSAYVATQDSPVQLVHVRHEAAAGFMADATSRATGVPGVALVTLGPGVTNTVTPAATAQLAGVPMLIVGGQSGTPQADKGAGMTLDTLPIMANVTSWAATVRHVERIPEYIDAAWRRMLTPPPARCGNWMTGLARNCGSQELRVNVWNSAVASRTDADPPNPIPR